MSSSLSFHAPTKNYGFPNSSNAPKSSIKCDSNNRNSLSFGTSQSLSTNKGDNINLVATHVATRLPPVVAPPPPPTPKKEETKNGGKLTAWTSIRQERWEGELLVEGEIPSWLRGTYLRNGPGLWHMGDHQFRHLFDGYATLVKLHFDNGRLVAGHRQLESEAYKAARKNNKICYREFSETPKPKNFVAYIGELANLFSGASLTDNANTGKFVIKYNPS